MSSTLPPYSAVNLATLAPPAIVEELSPGAIVDAMLAWLVDAAPELAGIGPSDPAYKLVELFAYRELLLRQRINEAVRAVLPATATGADLDQIAALIGVARAEGEDDTSLRNRIALGPEAWSTAGPVASYLARALAAHPDVADVSVTSPAPAEVLITVLGPGITAPSPEVLAAVAAACNADTARPVADRVTVVPATVIPVEVVGALRTAPGASVEATLANARAGLQALASDRGALGRDLPRVAIIGALMVPGVTGLTLTTPVLGTEVGPDAAVQIASITLTHSGVGR